MTIGESMSGSVFLVNGAHEHEMEHASNSGGSSSLAVATAILATVGAVFSYMGGYTQANAALFKNDAAIKKTEAANQWNFYQAKSTKQNMAELSAEIMTQPDKKQKYLDSVERYKTEKQEIKTKAEALEKESLDWDEQSEQQMHQHHRWAQATTSIQVSIALAAIALLTRRRWMEFLMYGIAAIGVGLGALAYLHV
jgi:hypothetical protein